MTRMDGDLDKVTIRLPKPLKDLIDTGRCRARRLA